MVNYGTGLKDTFEIDPDTGDYMIVSGVDNAIQHIRNRLLTKYGELSHFGEEFDNYGNKSYFWINTTDLDLAIGHIKIFTKECLNLDPFVSNIIGDIRAEHKEGLISVTADVLLVGGETVTIENVDIFVKDQW